MIRSLATLSLVFLTTLGCSRDYGLGITSSSGVGGAGATGVGGAGGGGGAGSGGGGGGGEPVGPTRLTIVNGVNDQKAIRICFLPYPAGDPSAMPWPSSSGGLGFASSVVVDPIESVIPPSSDVYMVVIAGDLSQAAGKSCEALVATGNSGTGGGGGTSPVIVSPLGVLPASVFTAEKSLLLVPMGCLDGGHDDASASLTCGQTYAPGLPNPGLVALSMSRRVVADRVSLQVVNASSALAPSDVRVTPPFMGAQEIGVVGALSMGAIGPKPPFTTLSLADYGPVESALLKVYSPNQATVLGSVTMGQVFANGGVGKAALSDGRGYTLVAVGSYPAVMPPAYGHPFTFSLVRADP